MEFDLEYLPQTGGFKGRNFTDYDGVGREEHDAIEDNRKVRDEIDKAYASFLKMVRIIAEKNGIDVSKDEYLKEMLKPLNLEDIEQSLEKRIK